MLTLNLGSSKLSSASTGEHAERSASRSRCLKSRNIVLLVLGYIVFFSLWLVWAPWRFRIYAACVSCLCLKNKCLWALFEFFLCDLFSLWALALVGLLPLSFGSLPSFEFLWFLRINCWMHIFQTNFCLWA